MISYPARISIAVLFEAGISCARNIHDVRCCASPHQLARKFRALIDLGIVTKVDHADGELTARLGADEAVFDFGELDALHLAYATTIHKSQGSEYPVVVLPLTMQAYTMLGRELIYTAVTRAKQLLVLVGPKKALAIAVKRRQTRRWSMLRDRLQSASSTTGNRT